MACACKVNQELEYLQKKYGHNMPKSKSSNIRGIVSGFFKQIGILIGILILAVPFLPLMLIGILIRLAVKRKKPIEIDKIFKLSET